MRFRFFVCLALMAALVGCSAVGDVVGGAVGGAIPTTGDTAADASSAQRFLPNLSNYGYSAIEASSISNAIATVGGSASLLTGDPIAAALIAQVDAMIQCYEGVGAVAARIYTESNLSGALQGQVPKVGALAIVNQDRLVNNFLQCAVAPSFSSQAAVEPCAGSGTFSRDGETLHYLYAATNPDLCGLFAAAMPAS
ncbi:MAG: hypothetical protein IT320_22605 [Anaerolineae bacterium]|nr:hypothetical protein [Anaerolineae bacterium]